MLCRATQDSWVIVESSDKTWSTREGNGKPLQCCCLENPKVMYRCQLFNTYIYVINIQSVGAPWRVFSLLIRTRRNSGTFLGAQWLGIRFAIHGTQVGFLVGKLRSQNTKEQLSPQGTTRDSACCKEGSRTMQPRPNSATQLNILKKEYEIVHKKRGREMIREYQKLNSWLRKRRRKKSRPSTSSG